MTVLASDKSLSTVQLRNQLIHRMLNILILTFQFLLQLDNSAQLTLENSTNK